MVTIASAVRQVKDDLPQLISVHVEAALAEQRDFTWRDRWLNPLTTTLLFVIQILNGNTAIEHLRHLAAMPASAAAYCQARMRLPLKLLERICQSVTGDLVQATDEDYRWRGHRVWRGDGSSFSMPDTSALHAHFGQPPGQAPGCGFPVATLLALDNAAGLITKILALPLRTHDASHAGFLHEALAPGDVLVYDRAGCSFTHLALLLQANLHGILRMHQRKIVSFRTGRKHARQYPKAQRKGKPTSQWIKRLGRHDQLVQWFKPKDQPDWMAPEPYDALPESLVLRELRYAVRRKGFRSKSITLVTTLLDAEQYPAKELADQYLGRWEIETNFRHLKQTMGMDVLKCKTVDGVLKELAVFTLVYNLVRLVMLRAAERQKVPLDRISFVDSLRWLRATHEMNVSINFVVNPRRPNRVEPRVIKRRPKAYPLMTRPRDELRQALLAAGVGA
jgi:hypothetical protein